MDQPGISKPGMSKVAIGASLMLGLLSIQYILGKLTNLYVSLPAVADTQERTKELFTNWQYAGHIIVGMLLVIVGILLVIHSFKKKHSGMKMLSIIGLLALMVASYGGKSYVSSYDSGDSLIMSLGFIVAMGVYGRFLSLVMMEK
jgi:uncharacterized BrkB/YihY/UPF0761 family membrane protein